MDGIICTYAAYSKHKKIRLESSSGAIFSLLADQVLNNSGVVYGVAMSADCKYAEYIRVCDHLDIVKLRGSKYLQARVGRTYQQVKIDLESGIVVLFSGTGCLINGLKGFLDKEYDNLYCVDVICHGIPSPKLWRNYAQYVEAKLNAKLININFRCKDDSWADFGIKRINEKYKALYISKQQDPFMIMFLRDYCLRPSCYECVAKKDKQSDLSMADFWGINLILPDMNDGNGVSLIIIRTKKGKLFFDQASDHMIIKEVSYEDGIKGNRAEHCSAKYPAERKFFFDDMNSMAFEDLKNKYAVPVPVPVDQRIKKAIKLTLRKLPILKLLVGGSNMLKRQDYGLFFIFVNHEKGDK